MRTFAQQKLYYIVDSFGNKIVANNGKNVWRNVSSAKLALFHTLLKNASYVDSICVNDYNKIFYNKTTKYFVGKEILIKERIYLEDFIKFVVNNCFIIKETVI